MFFSKQVAEIWEDKLNHANAFKVCTYISPLNAPSAKVSHRAKTNISGMRKYPSPTLVGRTAMSRGKSCKWTKSLTERDEVIGKNNLTYHSIRETSRNSEGKWGCKHHLITFENDISWLVHTQKEICPKETWSWQEKNVQFLSYSTQVFQWYNNRSNKS